MDQTDWEILRNIVREKSMVKVAERMFLSQPAVSYRLNRMEEEFGKTLFSRTNKGISLTSAGERLYNYAEFMVQYNQKILSDVTGEDAQLSGSLDIGTTENFLCSSLIHQIQDFHEKYPKIGINIVTDSSVGLLQQLEKKQLMLATLRGNPPKEGNRFLVQREKMMLVASQPITAQLLSTTPFIRNYPSSVISGPIESWIARHYHGEIFHSNVNLMGSSRGIIRMVRAGLGWSVVSSSRYLELWDELYYEEIKDEHDNPLEYNTYLYYAKIAQDMDVYAAYIAHLKVFFHEKQGEHEE